MRCDLCDKNGAEVRKLTRSYGRGKDLLVIEDTPAIACPHCGENCMTAATLHEIERIKKHRRNFATKRHVPVATFA